MKLPMDDSSSMALTEIMSLAYCLRQNIGQLSFMKMSKNITPTQAVILMFIHYKKGENVYQRDIEEKFSMRRSTITGVLNNMEINNLIYREHVAEDARLKKVCMTEKGLSLIQTLTNEMKQVEFVLTSGISDEEFSSFIRISEKMKRNLIK